MSRDSSLIIPEECQKPGQEEGAQEVEVEPLSFQAWFRLLEPTDPFMGLQFPVGIKNCLIKSVGKLYLLLLPFNGYED